MDKPDIKNDEMEGLLVSVMENADVIKSLLSALEKLKSAGIVNLMTGVVNDYVPTDVDFFGKFFSSKEFTVSMLKTMNVLVSVMGAMASEKNSDLIKGIMFNFENITDHVQDAVHNPKKYSPLKIRKLLSDEDTRVALAAMIAFLKAFGQILNKTVP